MESKMSKTSFSAGILLSVGLGAACGSNKSAITPVGNAGSGGSTNGAAGHSGAAGAQPDASGAAGGGIATSDAGDDTARGTDGATCSDGAADSCASADGSIDTDGAIAEILKVRPTAGCGNDPGQAINVAVMGTIDTMGTKPADCADSTCGPWMYTRQYFLTLPAAYDENRAYPLIIEVPGCGGLPGLDVYTINSVGDDNMPAHNLVDNSVIRVDLSPPPPTVGNRNFPSDCFDQYEGDDSVDWVFYENLYDKLAGQLCFDRNRVFAVGLRRGAPTANELGCKYAGDATRPIRGVLSDEGGLPIPMFLPTCTDKPTAGMWVNQTGNSELPFTQTTAAIARAMKVDGCTIGTGFLDAQFDDFPIGGGNPDTTCKKIKGCPDLTPLVVCAILGNGSMLMPAVANPGFSTFIKMFETAPLLPLP